jgi:2-methylisocitrate lyase-like PEP mutase family enzyme
MKSAATQDHFRQLHNDESPLLLPNAWDAASAALIASLGAKAIATTSAGLCWARGYADGNASLPVDELVHAARAIARVIDVPLSVDMEGGYSGEPSEVAELAKRLVEVGAAGINIEDGTVAPALLCRKIAAIRQAVGAGLFINVRTDVLLRSIAQGDAATAEVCRRAALYQAAGCDGIFVPGLADLAAMKTIAAAIAPSPLNVMLLPGLPDPNVLAQHGVRRLSAGSALSDAALGHTATLTKAFLAGNGEAAYQTTGVSYAGMNALFAKQ